MYYHPERKLVYLAHPHTASRSTAMGLGNLGFIKKPGEHHHAQLYDNGIVTPENREEWLVFTTVRNHFDFILAQVWKVALARHPGPDMDWSNLKIWQRDLGRANWLGDHTLYDLHKHDADMLVRFENLKDDLKRAVGGPVRLPRIGTNTVRKGQPYQKFYTPRVRAWVEERFGDEMKELGYAF